MLYAQQKVLLATKHEKQRAIAPVFKQQLHCDVWAPPDFDTDVFGTFTGEIPRAGTQYEALLLKAKAAAARYAFAQVIASEGSCGPHPTLYWMPGAVEMLAFLDLARDLTIVETVVTQQTNFAQLEVNTPTVSPEFLQKIGFPAHALIVRELATCGIIAKGIQTEAALLEAIQQGLQQAPTVRLETDMRAHMNPTRMEVIAQLAAQLATRIATPCPACQTPGFGEKGVEGHLVCENCGTQTELYAQRVLKCIRCEHKSFWPREDGLSKASPQYCPHCNP